MFAAATTTATAIAAATAAPDAVVLRSRLRALESTIAASSTTALVLVHATAMWYFDDLVAAVNACYLKLISTTKHASTLDNARTCVSIAHGMANAIASSAPRPYHHNHNLAKSVQSTGPLTAECALARFSLATASCLSFAREYSAIVKGLSSEPGYIAQCPQSGFVAHLRQDILAAQTSPRAHDPSPREVLLQRRVAELTDSEAELRRQVAEMTAREAEMVEREAELTEKLGAHRSHIAKLSAVINQRPDTECE